MASAPLAAPAQSLDISGPYGNADGCKFARDGSVDGDGLLLLQPDSVQSYATACEFVQVLPAKGGAKVVTGLCHFEGEESLGAQTFVIARSPKDPQALVIYESDGESWGEVRPCP